jgi:hypothetical protein
MDFHQSENLKSQKWKPYLSNWLQIVFRIILFHNYLAEIIMRLSSNVLEIAVGSFNNIHLHSNS